MSEFTDLFTDPLSIAALAVWYYRHQLPEEGTTHIAWHYGPVYKMHMADFSADYAILWLADLAKWEKHSRASRFEAAAAKAASTA